MLIFGGLLLVVAQRAVLDPEKAKFPRAQRLPGPHPHACQDAYQQEEEYSYHENVAISPWAVTTGIKLIHCCPFRSRDKLIEEASNDDGSWQDVDADEHTNSDHQLLQDLTFLPFSLVPEESTDTTHAYQPHAEKEHPHQKEHHQWQNHTEKQSIERGRTLVPDNKTDAGKLISRHNTGGYKADGHHERDQP